MIKKLNITLLVLFGGMLAFKMVRTAAEGRAPVSAPVCDAVSEVKSDLVIDVICCYKPKIMAIDEIANHNGFLLDELRAIFPKARFKFTQEDYMDESVRALATNPRAVAVFPTSAAGPFTNACAATTPLGWSNLIVLTPRTSTWIYKGHDSLKDLRILVDNELCEIELVRSLRSNGHLIDIKDSNDPVYGLFRAFADGTADAAFCLTSMTRSGEMLSDMTSIEFEDLRFSRPICRVNQTIFVSNLDTNFAQRVIADYEAGMKRIKESGERRRICEYYDFTDD